MKSEKALVLILGGTSDMAMAIANRFAQEKFDIILASRNHQRTIPFSNNLSIRYGIKCSAIEFDALHFESHESFLNSLTPLPQITVSALGYLGTQEAAETNWKEAEKIIQTNFTGVVSILNLIAERYKTLNKGTIIGISSVAGDRGRQSNFIYGSAKAGLTAYLSGLRNRLSSYGVHVMTVKPGFVLTRMTENLETPKILTASPDSVAMDVYFGFTKSKNILYTRWFWKWIMWIIKLIPEFLFKRLKL